MFVGKWTNLEPITLSKITQPQKDKYNDFPPKCNSYLAICLLSSFCHLFIIYLNHLPCIYLLIILSIYLVSTIYHLSTYFTYLYLCITYVVEVEGGQFGGKKEVEKDEGQEGN